MPQMSPMNWIFLSFMFMILIYNLKSFINMSQKNSLQSTTIKNSSQNMMKW